MAGQPFTDLLSPYHCSSEQLTTRVQIRCKPASKDFEYLNIHPCKLLSNDYTNMDGFVWIPIQILVIFTLQAWTAFA